MTRYLRTPSVPAPGLVLLLAVVGISSASIFIRISSAPALAIAFYRLAYAAVLHILLALPRLDSFTDFGRGTLWKSVGAGIFLAIHFGLWITSLGLTTVAASTVLVSFHPLFTAAGGYLLFGESLGPRALLAMLAGLVGTAILAFGGEAGEASTLTGDLLALGGAGAMAGYLLVGRFVRRSVGTLPYTVVVYSVAAVTTAAIAGGLSVPLIGYSVREHLIFAALAVLPTLFGHTLLNWALAHVQTSGVSLSVLGEPVAATLMAWLLLKETPAAHQLLGGSVILVALAGYLQRAGASRRSGGTWK
ncbi:MAG: DMT family transporter [Bacillota bacterium]